jgi:hypothetical protein
MISGGTLRVAGRERHGSHACYACARHTQVSQRVANGKFSLRYTIVLRARLTAVIRCVCHVARVFLFVHFRLFVTLFGLRGSRVLAHAPLGVADCRQASCSWLGSWSHAARGEKQNKKSRRCSSARASTIVLVLVACVVRDESAWRGERAERVRAGRRRRPVTGRAPHERPRGARDRLHSRAGNGDIGGVPPGVGSTPSIYL